MKKFLSFAFAAIMAVMLASCEKTSVTESELDSQAAVATLTEKYTEMTTLLDGAVFGTKKGNYPEASKAPLEAAIDALNDVITDFNAGKGTQTALDNAIKAADAAIKAFKNSVLTEDEKFKGKPGYLLVNNTEENSSYVDFGNNAEFINFGTPNDDHTYQYTVDMEVYIPVSETWNAVVFTGVTTDNGGGWGCNAYESGKFRWVVCPAIDGGPGAGWREEEYRFDNDSSRDFTARYGGRWTHIAVTFYDQGVNRPEGMDNMNGYVNGERNFGMNLDANQTYSDANAGITHMWAFARQEGSVNAAAPTSGWYSGSIRNFHIWNRALTPDEIQDLAAGEKVTKDSKGLVAGWEFTSTVEDNQNIPDITGKYSAKLVGPNATIVEGTLTDGMLN